MTSRPILLASALALGALMITPSAAHAGGYVGLGIGTAANVDGNLGNYFDGEDHGSGRLVLGTRLSILSIEAGLAGYGLTGINSAVSMGSDWRALNLDVAAKLNVKLAGPLEGYLRGGLERSYLDAKGSDLNYRGDGWLAGGGLELGIHSLIAEASIWADYTHEEIEVATDRRILDGSAGTFMLGVSLGI